MKTSFEDQLEGEIDQNPPTQFVYKHDGIAFSVIRIIVCSILCFVFFFFLLIGWETILFSKTYFVYGLIGFLCSLAVLILNIVLIVRSAIYIGFCYRYDHYKELFGDHEFEHVDDLVKHTKRPLSKIIKDLDRAIKLRLIPQGHLGLNNKIIFLSDKIYFAFQEDPSILDHNQRNDGIEMN